MLYINYPNKTDLEQDKLITLLDYIIKVSKKKENKELLSKLSNAISNAKTSKTSQSISLYNKPEKLEQRKMPDDIHKLLKTN